MFNVSHKEQALIENKKEEQDINVEIFEKSGIKELNFKIIAFYRALTDRRSPLYLKIILFSIIALTVSPFDLCPDFTSYLGYIDDIFLILLGTIVLRQNVPAEIKEEHLNKMRVLNSNEITDQIGGILFIILWLLISFLVTKLFIILY
jgi:uncharacterized membrane protein YkvA (DUF1232 family)